MYKTSNLSDVKCITFIKCWFKTQAGLFNNHCTVAWTTCLHNTTISRPFVHYSTSVTISSHQLLPVASSISNSIS